MFYTTVYVSSFIYASLHVFIILITSSGFFILTWMFINISSMGTSLEKEKDYKGNEVQHGY